MLLVIDIGNSRTKWAQVDEEGRLQTVEASANHDFAATTFKRSLKGVTKVMISNVAGDAMAQKISELIPQRVQVIFASAQAQACSVMNRYQQSQTLGVDRWSALIAAWHMNMQPSVVVNAGTAVTIDALAKDAAAKKGIFLGGTIMPGIRLMSESLDNNTALLKSIPEGKVMVFPNNTQDAIQTGCINAITGAIMVTLKQLEKHSAFLPKLVISGGDANKIADALKPHLKRVIIAENLVLQGLVLLESDTPK
jgi:type III pantothenate kinase